jgi:hypothetical protein
MRRQSTPLPARSGPTGRHICVRGSQRSPGPRGLLLAALLTVLSVVAVGCGSGSTTTSTATSTPAATTPAAATPTTSAPATTTAAVASGLSGTWKGQYGGGYSGTFVLKWQQSESNLSGTIKLSAPASTLNIHGTLSGSSISFGTVGSLAITYSGTVSGNSMSGNYQVAGSSGGSWSASKS